MCLNVDREVMKFYKEIIVKQMVRSAVVACNLSIRNSIVQCTYS